MAVPPRLDLEPGLVSPSRVSDDSLDDAAGPADAARRMALTRLTLTDFRNYARLLLRVDPMPVVLTGENGAGKTNLLEAISMLAPGRGLRRAPLAECARADGPGGWAVAAEVAGPGGSARLGTGMTGDGAGAARQCRIDGAAVSGPGAFADHLRMVWLTPAMDRLFSGPAGDRRRFLDRLVSTIDREHARHAADYDRAMSERNRLLAAGPTQPAWLDALEARMAEAGVAIAAARLMAIGRLAAFVTSGNAAGGFPPAELALAGTLEEDLATLPAVDVEDRFRDTLRDERGRDRAAGRALDGPHRSDLLTRHGLTGVEAGRCSTGEQKALLISIVLAQARLATDMNGGTAPLLLLDEVTAHLDGARREDLFAALLALGAQAWMTGTDSALFAPLGADARFFTVYSGHVHAV